MPNHRCLARRSRWRGESKRKRTILFLRSLFRANVSKLMTQWIIENCCGMEPMSPSSSPFSNQVFVSCRIQVVVLAKASTSPPKTAKAAVMVRGKFVQISNGKSFSSLLVGVTQDQGKSIGIMFLVRIGSIVKVFSSLPMLSFRTRWR